MQLIGSTLPALSQHFHKSLAASVLHCAEHLAKHPSHPVLPHTFRQREIRTEVSIYTGKPRYIAGMGPATQKYNGKEITGTGRKTKIFCV